MLDQVLFYVVLLVAGWLTGKVLSRFKSKEDPKSPPGLPVVGNALGLRIGTSYLQACREKVRANCASMSCMWPALLLPVLADP